MTLVTWFSLLIVCLMGAAFPGASLAVVLKQTLNHSRLHGVVTGLAHALGVSLYALLSVMGLMLILQSSPRVFSVILYAGAVYLIVLGVRGLMAKPNNGTETVEKTGATSLLAAAREGFLIALLNPKVGLFFLALFSQFVHAEMSVIDKMVFVGTITIVDGGWYVMVALLLSQGKLLLWLKHHQIWIERALGVILILLGLKIFIVN